jgi:hypothetical protein
MVAVVQRLTDLKAADERWVYHFHVDPETHQFQRILWMSPKQVSLAQRISDVVINDITMLCDMYGMPLNMFVVINHFFKTRNIAYALHSSETVISELRT